TSSHQVEGGDINNWSEWEIKNAERLAKRAKTYWQPWQIKKFPEILDPGNYIAGRACDHYRLFENDFKLAKELGHTATRVSIEWSRIEPEEGKFSEAGIEHYKKVVRTIKTLGLEPFVTIWHWPIPLWLAKKGGWENKEAVKMFSRYSEKIVSALGEDVKFWTTINEPEIYSSSSYLGGFWPPQKRNPFSYLLVLRNLVKAHRAVYKSIKKRYPEAMVGIAKNNIHFDAQDKSLISRLRKYASDKWWNFYFLDKIKDYQDFIGLNHYFHNRILRGKVRNENKVVSDMGWELCPEAIYFVLKDLEKYKKPIYITENGLADAEDKNRSWFLVETLKNIKKAIDDGVDVRGYLHWSLLDNFEWDKGFWPRFGLVAVDYKTFARKPRHSAELYKDIILANGMTESVAKKHINCCLNAN
ncbi:MAG: family 1 glycosylhydrolase, partial [Patescibacteria group bacterium]|nr:family 1 glycosylhydrolase [Patescibacteria group bacterium]